MNCSAITRRARAVLMAFAFFFPFISLSAGEPGGGWFPLAVVRFGNIDAVDADDGDLAVFLKSIRNDGRFIPPLRTLIGPEIRNPSFFGVTYEAWLEGVVLAPAAPGTLERVWLFPVDSRDEYLAQMASTGLSEYEGMDGMTVLRETGADGNVAVWHLEWLPGNVAVFGANRGAVAAAQTLYRENSASRGLLAGAGGLHVEPDFMIRLEPPRIASWQDREQGRYWWRDMIDRLAADLIAYWKPGSARTRLIRSLADEFAAWPRTLGPFDLSFWFEPTGVEWTMTMRNSGHDSSRSELPSLRRTPPRAALAYAVPVSDASFRRFCAWAGRLLLDAAGGVVTKESRETGIRLMELLAAARPTEAGTCWIAPPPAQPELGASRMFLLEWETPELLDDAWPLLQSALAVDSPVMQTAAQIGWKVSADSVENAAGVIGLRLEGMDESAPAVYYDALICMQRQGARMALVIGANKEDAAERARLIDYRTRLALQAVEGMPEGTPEIRRAFVRMGSEGSSILGIFDPVRFLQLSLIEAADWRPRSPDQHEPLSTQLAREMLEYGAGSAWTFEGQASAESLRMNGAMPWQSLSRLAAALGITESIGMDGGF